MVREETVEKPTRLERSRAARTRAILDVARALVVDEGLDALTLHRVAGALDVAVGGLYRYFPSKAALLAGLQLEALAEFRAALDAAFASAERAAARRSEGTRALFALAVAARVYADLAARSPANFALLGQIMADPRVLVPGDEAAAVMGAMTALVAAVGARFDAAAAAKALEPGDAAERTMVYWSALRGVLQMAKLRHHVPGLDAGALADHLAATLLRGWGAEPAALKKVFALAGSTGRGGDGER